MTSPFESVAAHAMRAGCEVKWVVQRHRREYVPAAMPFRELDLARDTAAILYCLRLHLDSEPPSRVTPGTMTAVTASRQDAWQQFAAASVWFPGFTVVPDSGSRPGRWPVRELLGWDTREIWVITACNPYAQLAEPHVNERGTHELESELKAAGLLYVSVAGGSSDRAWLEASFAVADAGREWVVDAADRYGQAAVFCWTPRAWLVVGFVPDQRLELGWRIEVDSSPAHLNASGTKPAF